MLTGAEKAASRLTLWLIGAAGEITLHVKPCLPGKETGGRPIFVPPR